MDRFLLVHFQLIVIFGSIFWLWFILKVEVNSFYFLFALEVNLFDLSAVNILRLVVGWV